MPLRLRRLAVPVALAALLSACGPGSLLGEWRMAPQAKQRAAFPPSPGVASAAQASARAEGDAASARRLAFDAEFERRLDRRVRECVPGPLPRAWTRIAEVRRAGADHDCLERADAALLDWFAQQDLSRLLRQPPAAPARPLGHARILIDLDGVPGADAPVAVNRADAADLAVVSTVHGVHLVVDLSGGRVVRSVDGAPWPDRPPALSPNGRVLAVATRADALDFVEVDTGRTVWRLPRPGAPLAFLDTLDAVIVADAADGATLLVDLATGQALPHPAVPAGVHSVLPAHGAPSARWLLSPKGIVLAEHQRTGAALAARHAGGAGWPARDAAAALPPVALDRDALVVARGRDGELSIARQRDGRWAASRLDVPLPWTGPVRFDDRRVLVQVRRGDGRRSLVVLDPAEGTASTLPDADAGVLLPLGHRPGFALVDGTLLRIGDAAQPGPARPAAELFDELRRAVEARE